jgi:hypothetical protein
MKRVSFLVVGAALLLAAPAAAQQQAAALGKEERAALLALQTALDARNYPAASAALPAAQASVRTGYARYLASALQLRLGIETGHVGLQSSAIDGMIQSGAVPAADLPMLYRNKAALVQDAAKRETAEAAIARYVELVPGDPAGLVALAQVKVDRKKPQEAVGLIEQAIAARTATGQPAPQAWYKRGLDIALANRMPQSLKFAQGLVSAYPHATNWRDALLVYRDTARPDLQADIDAWRLMRSAKALAGERDYLQFAQALSNAGFAAESKSVLDEGVAARMVDPNKAVFKELIASSAKRAAAERAGLARKEAAATAATDGAASLAAADALLSYGEYARAAALYRAALQKGGVDPSLASSRLGIALALAGQRTEAQAALGAVNGAREDLASLWLVWLAQRV